MGKGAGRADLVNSELTRLVAEELRKRQEFSSGLIEKEEQVRQALSARRAGLMPAQLEFWKDIFERNQKLVAGICTRQAGKTFVCKYILAEAVMRNPWVDRNRAQPTVQYIAQTAGRAEDLMYRPFKALCKEIGLEGRWNDHELRFEAVNGCLVRFGGSSNKDELEKYRGDAYRIVIIDESATFGPKMENLIIEIIQPALMAYHAPLVMIGTPGQAQAGYFWTIYNGREGWSVHRWSYMDNIHFSEEVRTIKHVEKMTGLPWTDPKVQREYAGKWVADTSSLVYHFDPVKNSYDGTLPSGHDWQYLLGMDLGFHDPTAFVVGAFARTHPELFVVKAESFPHMLPSEIAQHVLALLGQYGRFARIVCDTGGSMARSNVEEWNARYGFGMIGAEKPRKFDFIEMANSELALGRIKLHNHHAAPLVTEMKELVWEAPDPEYARTDYKRKEHAGFPNHNCDAFLYMFKESRHWRSKSPEPEPVPGTVEYLMKLENEAKMEWLKNRKRWEYGRIKN